MFCVSSTRCTDARLLHLKYLHRLKMLNSYKTNVADNGNLFLAYIEQQLGPTLQKGWSRDPR